MKKEIIPQEKWAAVDHYIMDLFDSPDPALDATLHSSNEAGLPSINVSPTQGKFLFLLAKIRNAHNILEIGTLGGYSTIWLARALPSDGNLVTLEIDSKHAEVALANIERAGLSDVVELRLGNALDTLPKLVSEGRGPFDLIFIDADKQSIPSYFTWALKVSHPGTLIIVDNVVRDGAVIDADSVEPEVQGVRSFNELVAKEKRISATTIQTVGVKGYDGFALLLVTE